MDLIQRVRQIAEKLLADLEPIASRLSNVAEDQLYPAVAESLHHCLRNLEELHVWGPENRLPSSELWNAAAHLLERGWLQNRARTKPRGYAGDYEMLARIYENRRCDDPLGRLFDRYFQEEAAPRAVQNRMRMMADWIVELASGGRESARGEIGRAHV